MKYFRKKCFRLFGNRQRKSYLFNLSYRWFHVTMAEWIIDFLPNLTVINWDK